MKKLFQLLLVGILLVVSFYLVLPAPAFPPPPPDALQSDEPADTETPNRRSYFTNYSRSELMAYYQSRFKFSPFRNLPLLQYTLNYPPEEAFSLIRDQTRSSWLQEVVHPWRESLYINGFYPTKPTEQINRDGRHYINKITIRYVPSHPVSRLTVLALCSVCIIWLIKEYAQA